MKTSRLSIAIALSGVFLSSAFGQGPRTGAQRNELFLDVAVTNTRGEWLGGLTRENFKVYKGKEVQPITSFTSESAPVSVGILVDVSGSFARFMDEVEEAVSFLVGNGRQGNEYFLMTFNIEPQLLIDSTDDPAAVLKVNHKLSSIEPKNNTRYYDALATAITKVSAGRHAKKAIVILSDATDNTSKLRPAELRRLVRGSDVILYTLLIRDPSEARTKFGEEALSFSEELANISGGRVIVPETRKELNDAALRVIQELRSQYRIGITPPVSPDGAGSDKWHQLDVKLDIPLTVRPKGKLSLRTRRGYYLPSGN